MSLKKDQVIKKTLWICREDVWVHINKIKRAALEGYTEEIDVDVLRNIFGIELPPEHYVKVQLSIKVLTEPKPVQGS